FCSLRDYNLCQQPESDCYWGSLSSNTDISINICNTLSPQTGRPEGYIQEHSSGTPGLLHTGTLFQGWGYQRIITYGNTLPGTGISEDYLHTGTLPGTGISEVYIYRNTLTGI
ncbi:unnamed protein product, partial [Staurois parvus]